MKLEDDLASQLALIEMYIAADSIPQAQSKLNGITAYNKELRSYKQLKNIELQLLANGYTWLDTAEYDLNTLWTLSADNTKASREAQAILSMVADTVFIELIEDIEDSVQYRLAYFEEEAVSETKDTLLKQDESLEIKVYPNPAKHQLIIEFSNDTAVHSINIYNILGSKSKTQILNNHQSNKHVIDISNLEKGVYLFEITKAQQRVKQGKLVKL